jgi:hypothetical protein
MTAVGLRLAGLKDVARVMYASMVMFWWAKLIGFYPSAHRLQIRMCAKKFRVAINLIPVTFSQ